MYVSEPLKIAWIRVPKTGSSSFYKATGGVAKWKRVDDDHSTLEKSKVPEGYKTLITIRNPYDWVRSVYCMCAKTPHWGEYVETEKVTISTPRTADQFFTFFKKTQLDWVKTPNGEVDVDEVLCIEDAKEFLSKHGMDNLETVNQTSHKLTELFEWTKQRLDWVRRKHAAELKYYPDNIANSK